MSGTCGAGTAYPTPVFSGVCATQSLVFCVLYVIACPYVFFFWAFSCLSFNL